MEKTNIPTNLDKLSELIAAAGNVAFEYSDNGREAYALARAALVEMIRQSARKADSDEDFETLPTPTNRLH
jgi:hypothetical protein